jgi:hypothetical protein
MKYIVILVILIFILFYTLFSSVKEPLENNYCDNENNDNHNNTDSKMNKETCAKSLTAKHSMGNDVCTKTVRDQRKIYNIRPNGGDNGGKGKGYGDGNDGGNKSGIGSGSGNFCRGVDKYGRKYDGVYDSNGNCIETKINPSSFCPSEIRLIHDGKWNLKVSWPYYRYKGDDTIHTDVTRYYHIEDYVFDLIRIDDENGVDCNAVYIL